MIAQLLQWLSYGLDFWGIAVRIPTVTRHSFLLWSIQNSSEAPLNVLLDTGNEVVGAYSWPLAPAQNQVNNGRIYNSTPPYAVMMSAGTLILNTPLPRMNFFSFLLLFNHQGRWPLNQTTYLHYAYQTGTVFTKLSRTEYGGLGRPHIGSERFRGERTLCSSRESNPGQPKHKLTRPTGKTVADLSLPAARWH